MVKIKTKNNSYSKDKATVQDWYNYLDISDKIKDKNMLADKEMYDICIGLVKKYLDIPEEEDLSDVPLCDMITAYQKVQLEIGKAFSESAKLWGNELKAE